MMRAKIMTTAYCNAKTFNAGMRSLVATTNYQNHMHVILDQHYPLDSLDVSLAICKHRNDHVNVATMDAGKNIGLHEGYNLMLDRIRAVSQKEDIVIAYDADEAPQTPGWIDAMIRVFEANPSCGWLSLICPAAREVLDARGVANQVIGGERVRIPGWPLVNTVCAWRISALEAVGGKLFEPHAFYGGIEVAMMPKFVEAGYWVGWLNDYETHNHNHMHDESYTQYKQRHVGHKLPVFPGSFEEFLIGNVAR